MNVHNTRLWKLNSLVGVDELLKTIYKSKKKYPQKKYREIKAILLKGETVLDDSEIGEKDILLVEFKHNDEW